MPVLLNLSGTWSSIDVSMCFAFVNSRCDDARTCLNGSVCQGSAVKACMCPTGFDVIDADALRDRACVRSERLTL